MLHNDIQQPVEQNQTQSGIAADEMTEEQKEDVTEFAAMLQQRASSHLPDVYEAAAGCVTGPHGVVVKVQIFHGDRPLVGGDVMIQEADKPEEKWEEQSEEIMTQMLAKSINELLQNDTNAAPKAS